MTSPSPAQVADVLGVLAVAGTVVVVLTVTMLSRRQWRRRLFDLVGGTGTFLATGVAAIATAGSLWFSERAGFPPCELCWYQRIAMYPLVVVLAVAAFTGERSARIIAFVLAGAGLAVNIWHNVIQTFSSIGSGGSCDPHNPCTLRWIEGLGFWTIPRLATVAFVLILLFTAIEHRALARGDK